MAKLSQDTPGRTVQLCFDENDEMVEYQDEQTPEGEEDDLKKKNQLVFDSKVEANFGDTDYVEGTDTIAPSIFHGKDKHEIADTFIQNWV